MREYCLRRLGTKLKLKVLNSDVLPRMPALGGLRGGEQCDAGISLCRLGHGTGTGPRMNEWGEGAVYYFGKDVLLEHAIMRSVNDYFVRFQRELGVVFFHAASVGIGKKAYLFVAPSGGGKTTVSRLAEKRGYEVLGEECAAVRRRNSAFYTATYPVDDFSSRTDDSREVKGVYFLKKSDRTAAEEIPVNMALRLAMPQATYFYNAGMSPAERAAYRRDVFAYLETMLSKVRFAVLGFNRTGDLFDHIRGDA